MTVPLLQLFAGLLLLFLGAESLVRGAAAIALRLGISALVVGLTVVAFGTSCPELLVCLKGALSGQPGLAVGNAVGSNIFNLGAILGLVALIYPIRCQAQVIIREIPVMIAVSLLFGAFVYWGGSPTGGRWSGELTRVEGGILLGLVGVYTVGGIWQARREPPSTEKEFADDVSLGGLSATIKRTPIWLSLLFIVAGGALLTLGADLMVKGAVTLGQRAGLSELVIGLTIVGAGTGLPELATSIVAAFRKEPDIALGNVVGSCVFNLLGILGATALVVPLGTEPLVLLRDFPVMLVLSLLLLPVAISGKRISRGEGALLLSLYISYVTYLVVTTRG